MVLNRWLAALMLSVAALVGCGEPLPDRPRQQTQAGGAGCPTTPTVVFTRRQVREDLWHVLSDGRVVYREVGIERILTAPPISGEGWRSASAIPWSETGSRATAGVSYCNRAAIIHRRVAMWRYDISQINGWEFYNKAVRGLVGGTFRTSYNLTAEEPQYETRNAYLLRGRFFAQANVKNQAWWEYGLVIDQPSFMPMTSTTFFPESVYRVAGMRITPEPMSFELVGMRRDGVLDEPPFPDICQSISLGGVDTLKGPRETRATYQLTCVNGSVIEDVGRMYPWDAHSRVFGARSSNAWNIPRTEAPTLTIDNMGCLRCSVGVQEQR